MRTEFRRAILPDELRSLVTFDHKAFHEYPNDWFDREYWLQCESWWLLIDGVKVGCCAFQSHLDFREDLDEKWRPDAFLKNQEADLLKAASGKRLAVPIFRPSRLPDDDHPRSQGSLYIATTGILPRFRRQGFGALLKTWQIAYARRNRFDRILTNTRKSNLAMIKLNQKFGFKIIRTTPRYYQDPIESTVVMELAL